MKKATLAILATLALAAPAWATEGEHEISVGVAGGALVWPWIGLDARWLYDLTDFWAIGAGLHNRNLFVDGSGREALTFEARFVVDALQWVPSIGAAAGVGLGQRGADGPVFADGYIAPNTFPNGPGLYGQVNLGVDYRPARTWGVGARAGVETDQALWALGGYRWFVGVYWNWYGGKGIGLDL